MSWIATQKTSDATNKAAVQIALDATYRYFVWKNSTDNEIWFGRCELDGSNWITVKLRDSGYQPKYPLIKVVGAVVYYCWIEQDSVYGIYQLWMATSNIDGTNFLPVQLTNYSSGGDIVNFDFEIPASVDIYYVWTRGSAELYIGKSNSDGSGFSESMVANSRNISGDGDGVFIKLTGAKLYCAWTEYGYATLYLPRSLKECSFS